METNYVATKIAESWHIDALYSLHYFAYSKEFRFEGERHPFGEIVCCDSGEAHIADEDKEFILRQGEAILHAPNVFHNVRPARSGTNMIVAGFGGDFSGLALPAGKPLTLGAYARQCLRRTLEIGKQAFAAPLGIVYQTSLTLRQDAPPYALQAIRAALEGVLFSLTEKYTPAKDIPDDAAAHILTILRGCVGERLTIKDLAARLGYSAAYLKKTFKTRTGESIMQTFIRMKIERAKQLLAEEHYTVSETAELLGYDTVQYFSKQFKDLTNMSPSAYAKSVAQTGILR